MSDCQLLKGAPLAKAHRETVATTVERLRGGGITPCLAVVVASDDPAVRAYADSKGRTAAKLGIDLKLVTIDPAEGQAAAEQQVTALSADPSVHGILIEVPVDKRLDDGGLIARLDPTKDVDGLTSANLGLVAAGREADALASATPLACIELAASARELRGAVVAVVGRGRSVGRALIPMLVNRDATVTVCHTKTKDLAAALAPADIIFVAAGRAGLLGPDLVRSGQIVVDAGINVTDDGITGDADPAVADVAAAMTPVPGGVGPLTSTLIFVNLMKAMSLQGIELASTEESDH